MRQPVTAANAAEIVIRRAVNNAKKPAPAALSGAKRQRSCRKRNAAGRINLVIEPDAKAQLAELAELKGLTIHAMLEKLISNAK